MDALLQKINEASAALADKRKQISELEATANAHEAASRECRLKRTELKLECEALQTLLHNSEVQQRVVSAEQAAMTAKSQAEAVAAQAKVDAEAAKAEQDAMLAKLKEQQSQLEALLAKAKE